ncbi:hypothetical protein D3C87_2059850 [compost metagenome]
MLENSSLAGVVEVGWFTPPIGTRAASAPLEQVSFIDTVSVSGRPILPSRVTKER